MARALIVSVVVLAGLLLGGSPVMAAAPDEYDGMFTDVFYPFGYDHTKWWACLGRPTGYTCYDISETWATGVWITTAEDGIADYASSRMNIIAPSNVVSFTLAAVTQAQRGDNTPPDPFPPEGQSYNYSNAGMAFNSGATWFTRNIADCAPGEIFPSLTDEVGVCVRNAPDQYALAINLGIRGWWDYADDIALSTNGSVTGPFSAVISVNAHFSDQWVVATSNLQVSKAWYIDGSSALPPVLVDPTPTPVFQPITIAPLPIPTVELVPVERPMEFGGGTVVTGTCNVIVPGADINIPLPIPNWVSGLGFWPSWTISHTVPSVEVCVDEYSPDLWFMGIDIGAYLMGIVAVMAGGTFIHMSRRGG